MKRMAAWVLVSAFLILSGCECVKGLGRDMQKAGNWVEKKAEQSM